MYLEHISVVHSVRGDISRTAALEKLGLLALSLWRLAELGRLPRQRLAVIAVDLALLLRRQLRKPHLTGVALNQCSSAPPCCPWSGKGQGGLPSPFIHPDSLFQATLWDSLGLWCISERHTPEKQQQIPLSTRYYWYHISDISRKRSAGLLFISPQGCSVTC